MGRARKVMGWIAVGLIALIAIAFVVLRTPDTDREAMIAKYGGGESRFLTLGDGATVHIRDTGGAEGQPAMILLHGSNASLHTWEPLVERLRRDWRIVRIDLPGHGLTGATPTGRYDTPEMVETVAEVATAVGLQSFILGGNSMGGKVSWHFALAHPERVQALLLLAPAGMPRPSDEPELPPSSLASRVTDTAPGRWLMTQITPRSMVGDALRAAHADGSQVSEAEIDRYWELLRFPGNRAATAQRYTYPWVEDAAVARAGEISAPALVIFGDQDRLIAPTTIRTFAARLRNVETQLWQGVGHLPMEEDPDLTAAAIRTFLGARGLGPRPLPVFDAQRE